MAAVAGYLAKYSKRRLSMAGRIGYLAIGEKIAIGLTKKHRLNHQMKHLNENLYISVKRGGNHRAGMQSAGAARAS